MDLKEELKKIQEKQKENALQGKKLLEARLLLAQEALRLEGEARIIQRLMAIEEKDEHRDT